VEEKYRKFKGLTSHFKSSIEKDRKYLAVELHEELAQLATVVRMDIDWIRNYSEELNESSKARLDHALAVSDLLINGIRKVSYTIGPNMLDDLGLNETLKWLCEEFAMLHGIPCRFESSCDEKNLTQEIKLDFFRICQEFLNNIMYKAEAIKVKIMLKPVRNRICLSLADAGKGFHEDHLKQTLGITSIRERVASINGVLTIDSGKGRGTKVSVLLVPDLSESYR
jgi:signal transduction histidine kinase